MVAQTINKFQEFDLQLDIFNNVMGGKKMLSMQGTYF
jgi:hypothetical protein